MSILRSPRWNDRPSNTTKPTMSIACLTMNARRWRLSWQTLSCSMSPFVGSSAEEVHSAIAALEVPGKIDIDDVVERVSRVLGCLLVERGEAFVDSIRTGVLNVCSNDELRAATEQDLTGHQDNSGLKGNLVAVVVLAIESTLASPSPDVLSYLNRLAESYTLRAPSGRSECPSISDQAVFRRRCVARHNHCVAPHCRDAV